MRKRIINLTLSLLSVVLAVTLFTVGVVAARSATSSVNGTFKFTPPSDAVFVKIDGQVVGSANQGDFLTNTYHHNENDINSWPEWTLSEKLIFNKRSEQVVDDIVFKFKIVNYTNRALKFEFTNISPNPEENGKMQFILDEAIVLNACDIAGNPTEGGSVEEFKLILRPQKPFTSFDMDFSFTLSITEVPV